MHTPTYLSCIHMLRLQTGLYVIYTISCNGSFHHTNPSIPHMSEPPFHGAAAKQILP
jgi:hypothetical protein